VLRDQLAFDFVLYCQTRWRLYVRAKNGVSGRCSGR
jgi:hypothetical protein